MLYAKSEDCDLILSETTTEPIEEDKDLTAIVQVSRIGAKLTMDMTCYLVEIRDDTKVDIKLAFSLGTAYNVSPAVVDTVIQKFTECVQTELHGLDWGTSGDMLGFLTRKI